MDKAIVIHLLHEYIDIDTQDGVLTILGTTPSSYVSALHEINYLNRMISKAKYNDAKSIALFIEDNVYSYGIAIWYLVRYQRVRIVVKRGGELIDLSDFIVDPITGIS